MAKSAEFLKWKDRYDKKWVNVVQLNKLVELGVLKQAEVDEIVS